MTELNHVIRRAEDQLRRGEMCDLMEQADQLLRHAQALNSLYATGNHGAWKALEDARDKIALAYKEISSLSDAYVREAAP